LKRHRNECRPTVERPAADVDRIVDDRRVVLHKKPADAAEQATGEDHQGYAGLLEADRLSQFFHRKWTERVHVPVSFRVGAVPRFHERRGAGEFRKQAVNRRPYRHNLSPDSFACGTSVLISKIEIIGRKRINNSKRQMKSPMVPTNVAQSQPVAWYVPHDE